MIGFDGVQRGATRHVAGRRMPATGISIIDGPEIVRTSAGYAMLLWQGALGCQTLRLDNEANVLSESPLFAMRNFCEDLAPLSDGALMPRRRALASSVRQSRRYCDFRAFHERRHASLGG